VLVATPSLCTVLVALFELLVIVVVIALAVGVDAVAVLVLAVLVVELAGVVASAVCVVVVGRVGPVAVIGIVTATVSAWWATPSQQQEKQQ